MLKGTQVLIGEDALRFETLCDVLCMSALSAGYERVYIPSIWEAQTFKDKIQGETLEQMWEFKDKGDRDVCLVPEITGIIQDCFDTNWSKSLPKPCKIYYLSRCYRYENPKAGRLREFTQFGIEYLGKVDEAAEAEVKKVLEDILERTLDDKFEWHDQVKRGLGYYTEEGFEALCPALGAEKQIAGGGRYKQGIGWAIGVERLLMAITADDVESSSAG